MRDHTRIRTIGGFRKSLVVDITITVYSDRTGLVWWVSNIVISLPSLEWGHIRGGGGTGEGAGSLHHRHQDWPLVIWLSHLVVGASEALETGDGVRARADRQEEECYQPAHCYSSVCLTTVKEGKLGVVEVEVVRLINNSLFIMSPLHSTPLLRTRPKVKLCVWSDVFL